MYFRPSISFSLLLLPLLVSSQSTITMTSPAASTTPSTEYTSDDSFKKAILDSSNFYRKEHNATALTWNDTSADYASEWADDCNFKHSGGPTGENLAAGYANTTASIIAWGSERTSYSFSSAQFSEKTGHFTQLVWKSTTSVGCGRKQCDGDNGTPGWYVVCEYFPPGNVIGAFKENVQSQVEGSEEDNPMTGELSAGEGVRVRWDVLGGVLAGVVFAAGLW